MGHKTEKFKWRVERRGVLAGGDSLDVVGKETARGWRVLELLATLRVVEDQQVNIAWCLLEMQDLRPHPRPTESKSAY